MAALLGATALFSAARRADAASPLKVTSAAVCASDAETCEPTEQVFGSGVASLRFVTVVEGATGEAWVEHVWRREGREVFRLKLGVKAHRTKTASKKSIAGLAGNWTVVALDPVGRELAKVSFLVEPPEGEAAAPAP